MKRRLAIIGASTGQLDLCKKAKSMGLDTFCFAWPQGAVCKEYVDHFFPVSIFETEKIVNCCEKFQVDGVVSNASESTALVASIVAEKLGLVCTPSDCIRNIQNKAFVRQESNRIKTLSSVKFTIGKLDEIVSSFPIPYILKPLNGSAKKGVNLVNSPMTDLSISSDLRNETFMAEEYIPGKEYSVESISFMGKHKVIQITEKIGTGAPHFVELEHHQPAILSSSVKAKVESLIPQILSVVGFTNGASHTEIKVSDDGAVSLIEVNPRGGGDFISNVLVGLSTDCDYLKQMILVALGSYQPIEVRNIAYAGIYFLSAYTERLLPYFENERENWMVQRERYGKELTYSSSNYDRNGYIIYCSDKKIIL